MHIYLGPLNFIFLFMIYTKNDNHTFYAQRRLFSFDIAHTKSTNKCRELNLWKASSAIVASKNLNDKGHMNKATLQEYSFLNKELVKSFYKIFYLNLLSIYIMYFIDVSAFQDI